ncbi:MAG TPA: hypothetical protein VK638_17865 [Edaphobacter sp.]|nr:hypothetical protein [Edaphobacter sp.]
MQVTFDAHSTQYTLSTDHSQSSYGIPVLVTAAGDQLGPWDVVRYSPYASWTARAIANFLSVLKPEGSDSPYTSDPAIREMVERFLAVNA